MTFDRSRARTSRNPTPAQMGSAVKALRQRYPFVKEFATWNEANINKQPATVAKWWLAMRKACPSCTVLGADLLDRANVGTWARASSRRQADAEGLGPAQLRRRQPRLDEGHARADQGGQGRRLVHRDRRRRLAQQRLEGDVPDRRAHAAKATKFVFSTLVKVSPRVKRVYIYHWNTGVGDTTGADDDRTWDSGLDRPATSRAPRWRCSRRCSV